MSYAEKLKHPKWQKKRLEVMEYAQFRCQLCGKKDETLHVHHSYYSKGKDPWQYPAGSLICVCATCHGKIHPPKQKAGEPPAALVDPEDAKVRFDALRALLKKDAE